ncbi:MAG: hypothetical protein ACO3FI_07345 [Cyclobacteriaceae bacterium]
MKKNIFLFLFIAIFTASFSQDYGLSFSYFIPKNGSFSTPVSPFSIRGIGLDLNRNISFESGATLYRMSGLNISGLPFKNKQPMAGPNLTVFIPVEIVFRLKGKTAEFNINGGGFVYHGFFQKLNEGNIDRAIRDYEDWKLANSDFTFSTKPGAGWKAGAEIVLDVTRQWGISLEVNYLSGSSPIPVKGNYSGLDSENNFISRTADFKKAKIDLTGIEFSIAILMRGR